ncbi:MAG: holo-ACP synthase [Actinomycetaceae bacterium]|nr:holo-ACP synthase [Actinomycetaceae bacterium]
MLIANGVDIVYIPGFAQQLRQPGTVFAEAFTSREIYDARTSSGDSDASLAARWAAKEAVVKAWSSALFGQSPVIEPDLLCWSEIEIVHDRWHRPALRLHGQVKSELTALASKLREHYVTVKSCDALCSCKRGQGNGKPDCHHNTSTKTPTYDAHKTQSGMYWHISLSHDGDYAVAIAQLCIDKHHICDGTSSNFLKRAQFNNDSKNNKWLPRKVGDNTNHSFNLLLTSYQ